DKFHTYVILKLQNVKSSTLPVKGKNPVWDQDFVFETMRLDTVLVIELWNKGLLWDKVLGTHWLPLATISISNTDGDGQWISIDSEIVLKNGETFGTQSPTGHHVLIDCRFEIPTYNNNNNNIG
ncbi:hypothetical protein HELRODRAFT_73897, partial [Helobdella robusta]|uniref:C2 domain-containing protein n=1 Tax=Helobdella robusta TaxID=6412 RepID=T1G1K4_HELRO